MPTISLRRSGPADEEFLYQVFFLERQSEFAVLGLPDAQLHHLLRGQSEAQITTYSSRFPESRYEIVLLDGDPAGRIWVARQADEIRIVDVVMLPNFRSAGIGAELVRRLQAEAQAAGLPIRVSVSRFNPGSLRFHERLGFRIVGEGPVDLRMEWKPVASPL
jgi:ribosomal protein S18 acetylase RimI-like enzyme